MLSKKMAFSLTSLITILALAFVVPIAMAADGGPTVTISTEDNSTATGKQVRLRDPADIDGNGTQDDPLHPTTDPDATLGDDDFDYTAVENVVIITVEFSNAVEYEAPDTADADQMASKFNPDTDVMIQILDKDNKIIPVPTGDAGVMWAQVSGTKYQAAIPNAQYQAEVTNVSPALNTLYTMAVEDIDSGTDGNQAFAARMSKVIVSVNADVANAVGGGKTHGKGNQAASVYEFSILEMPATSAPTTTIALVDATAPLSAATARVKITLSEVPKEFKKDHVVLAEAALTAFDKVDDKNYIVTITPAYAKTDDIQVKVKLYEDRFGNKSAMVDTGDNKDFTKITKFTVAASVVAKTPGTAGSEVGIDNDYIIPVGGSLIVAKDDGEGDPDEDPADDGNQERTDSTFIMWPGDPKQAAADIALRKPALRTYNMVKAGLPDLESFLLRGGTIDLKSGHKVAISEIMWATDGGSVNRQWIEIMNMSTDPLTTKDYKLVFYGASEPVPAMTADGKLPTGVADRVGNIYKGAYWSVVGKGQTGRTDGIIERKIADAEIDIEVVGTTPLISMQRKMMADGTYANGTMESSWTASTPPAQNFVEASRGLLVGTPGASPLMAEPAPVPVPAPVVTPPADVAKAADIKITEIMVDTGAGRLPQWIELNNVSGVEKSLAGWSLEIENAAADADAIGRKLSIDLMGTLGVSAHTGNTGQGQSLLLVSWAHRSSSNLQGHKRIKDVSSEVGGKGRYKLISDMGFMITLVPPQTTGILTYGDMAGNLGAAEAWEIPMSENGRSSLIRREMLDDGTATMGTSANGWMLASGTTLTSGPATWYGSDEDSGTPGYDAGGPLPVELSHFRPARDKATGAVVITWSTQSELNNAGFFIKRSQQRDGQFEVINAAMIAGAGTTSEKQFYTYTDTTAQPNVVYYYQIEDVSLDGQRQTLTRGIRLKGHIGAAGKATTLWGELKSSNE